MSDPRPEELIHAAELLFDTKIEEALEIVVNFEKHNEMTSEEKTWTLLLRGWVYVVKQQFKTAVEIGNRAYQLSNEEGMKIERIEALCLKAYILRQGKVDEARDLILEAEELLNSLTDKPSSYFPRVNLIVLLLKTGVCIAGLETNSALELVLQSWILSEKTNNKLFMGIISSQIAAIFISKNKYDVALEFAQKGLKLAKELEFQIGIATNLFTIGLVYFLKGDLNKALETCDRGLAINEISNYLKSGFFTLLGGIYTNKGELDLALKYQTKGQQLAEETQLYEGLASVLNGIATVYRLKGDYEQATIYFKRSLALSQNIGFLDREIYSQFYLFLLNFEHEYNKQAQLHLERLGELADQNKIKYYSQVYLLAKAIMLKKKGLTRNKAEAERILKQIVSEDITKSETYILAIITLCDFLLEELYEYNDPDVLDELNRLIIQLINLAENQNSYLWITEGKLLQAKLALVQIDLEKGKVLLTQAQQIAEEHSLNLLAQKISNEHDILLERADEWDKLKNENAPMADRIKLASIDGVIERFQGKKVVDPPELVNEEPILLLIMDNSGTTCFNHTFSVKWDHSDLFSSFMSAFNTFSDEIFSKSIDRIRIGENTILINPVEPFLACYVIKGQSYPALQKLTRFTEAIKTNSEIWEALNKSIKTSEILELDKPPILKTIISEIFIQ